MNGWANVPGLAFTKPLKGARCRGGGAVAWACSGISASAAPVNSYLGTWGWRRDVARTQSENRGRLYQFSELQGARGRNRIGTVRLWNMARRCRLVRATPEPLGLAGWRPSPAGPSSLPSPCGTPSA